MTDAEAREKAAREYVDRQYGISLPSIELQFQDGWQAALNGPAVNALVRALKLIAEPAPDDIVPDISTSDEEAAEMWMRISFQRKRIARQALEAFEKARGGE